MKFEKNGDIKVFHVNPIDGFFSVWIPVISTEDGYEFATDISQPFSLDGDRVIFEEDFWRPVLSDADIDLIRNQVKEGCETFGRDVGKKFEKHGNIKVCSIAPPDGFYSVEIPIVDTEDGCVFATHVSRSFSFDGDQVIFEEDFWKPFLSDADIDLIRNQLKEHCVAFWRRAQEQVDCLIQFMDKDGLSFEWTRVSTFSRSIVDYLDISRYVPKNMVVLDLGCGGCGGAYATHSWLFQNHVRYIGVDCWGCAKTRLDTGNSEFFRMDIQSFLRDVFPDLGLDLKDVFAICVYVPDDEALRMVAETFPYCRVLLPGSVDVERKPSLVLPDGFGDDI